MLAEALLKIWFHSAMEKRMEATFRLLPVNWWNIPDEVREGKECVSFDFRFLCAGVGRNLEMAKCSLESRSFRSCIIQNSDFHKHNCIIYSFICLHEFSVYGET